MKKANSFKAHKVHQANRGERIRALLVKLAKTRVFSDIPDPVAWQQNERKDRQLPQIGHDTQEQGRR